MCVFFFFFSPRIITIQLLLEFLHSIQGNKVVATFSPSTMAPGSAIA